MQKFAVAAVLASCAGAAIGQDIRLSHSTEEILVVAGVGISCAATGAPQTTVDNSYWREFDLGDFGVTTGVDISSVEFGIESLTLPTLLEADITVNLFQAPAGSAPATTFDQVGSAIVSLGDRALEVITVDVTGSLDAGTSLIVEIQVPDFQAEGGAGDVYFPGANSFGESAPSYISSVGCATPEPVTYASIGFPETHLIIVANGSEGSGGGCRADLDDDGELTIFDFLAFQSAFDASDPVADFDDDGEFTIFDFLAFQSEFDAGCP